MHRRGADRESGSLWGKAGQRSLERSALVEAIAQLTHALGQIAALPATSALRREEIKLQVALITPLIHVKGYAAPETKAVAERARLLIEQADMLGEPTEDPLLLFSVLYSFWTASSWRSTAMLCAILRRNSCRSPKSKGRPPLVIGHRLMGHSLMLTGNIAERRAHYDQSVALYDPTVHRPLATRFGQDAGVATLCFRSLTLWLLGYPDAALADAKQALREARDIGQAANLFFALLHTSLTHIQCGDYAVANAETDELAALTNEKGSSFWKALGMSVQGCLFALTGKVCDAVQRITSGIAALRSTGTTLWMPLHSSYFARAYAELGQFDDAWRSIGEAMTAVETTTATNEGASGHRPP